MTPFTCLRSLPALFVLAATASGQCGLSALAGGRTPDADGPVWATCNWDPDGPGPATPVLVVAGRFGQFCGVATAGVVTFDPATGIATPLASSIVPGGTASVASVFSVSVTANNDLLIAGDFASIDGIAVHHVARWDGASWHPLGSGLPGSAGAVLGMANGDVIAGARAPWPGSQIRRWDGNTWSDVGGGLFGPVACLFELPNGDVLAGGSNLLPGAGELLRWDGTSWSAFGGGVDGTVHDLQLLANGDLLACGLFTEAGGVPANRIARWDGTTWHALGNGFANVVFACTELPNGDIVAGGEFTTENGAAGDLVARWDGSSWQAMGAGLGVHVPPFSYTPPVRSFAALPNGDLLAAGAFLSEGGDADHVARWNGSAWRPLLPGTGGAVRTSLVRSGGELVVAGDFRTVEGVPANYIAQRTQGVWHALGGGLDGPVEDVIELPNGDLVVGGRFSTAGGVPASNVARWDGTAWHAFGSGLPGAVHGLARLPSGEIFASGAFSDAIARWDGAAWNGTGLWIFVTGAPQHDRLLVVDGELFAAIPPGSPASGLARWDGAGWQAVVSIPGATGPLLALPNGDLIVVTSGMQLSFVRRWDGVDLSTIGGSYLLGQIEAVLALPDGDLLIGGAEYSGVNVVDGLLRRWDGSAWQPAGSGVDGIVHDLRWTRDGRVFVGGEFATLLGESTSAFAEIATTCPGTAVVAGVGCGGVGLATAEQPWLGGTFHSTATGLPTTNAIAAEVYGLAPANVPLASALPAGATCVLLTTPDIVRLAIPTAGSGGALELQFAIPNAPSLLQATLRQQVVPFALDAQGGIAAVTASNALQLTIGRF